MCGKDKLHVFMRNNRMGSPPHVRERPPMVFERRNICRITPACAGKTLSIPSRIDSAWDHPRMCGKDHAFKNFSLEIMGSPPHVRERPYERAPQSRVRRITPACAGKTCRAACLRLRDWDHPRMCGKDTRSPLRQLCDPGSPPHVRERQSAVYDSVGRRRITPACAGKTYQTAHAGAGR